MGCRDARPLHGSKKKKACRPVRILRRFICVFSVCCLLMCLGLVALPGNVHAADPTIVRIIPATQEVSATDSFEVTVECIPGQPVKAFELKLSFNPSLLRATAVSEGDFFNGYPTFFNPGDIDNVGGSIINIYNLIVGPGTVTSPGVFVIINFTAKSVSGTSTLGLYDVRVTNETAYITITVSSASVTVTGGSPPPPPPGDPPDPENTPPETPLKPHGPSFAAVGITYSYSSAAVDPDGDLVRLRFDWGDGTLSDWTGYAASNTTLSASHAWEESQSYTVRVIAQDSLGANSSWSEPLTVLLSSAGSGGSIPVVSFSAPLNATVNQSILFDASGVYDPDEVIVSYVWEFGDGTTAEGTTVHHTYTHPGQYTVTLTLTDAQGITYSTSQVISIAAEAPLLPDVGAGIEPVSLAFLLFFVVAAISMTVLIIYLYRTRIPVRTQKRKYQKATVAQTPPRQASLQHPSEPVTIKTIPVAPPRSVSLEHQIYERKPTVPHTTPGVVSLKQQLEARKRTTPQTKTQSSPLQNQRTQRKRTVPQAKTKHVSSQKQQTPGKTKRPPAQSDTVDIDFVVDGIFAEMARRQKTLTTDKILDAYNALIVERVEKNPSLPLPSLNIRQVEELIDRRMHEMVAEKIDTIETR